MWDFIAGVFALTVLASLIGGLVGLISPRTVQFRFKEPPTRKRVAGVAFGMFIVAFVGFAITVPEPTPEQKAAIEAKKNAENAREKERVAQADARRQDEVLSLWNSIKAAGTMCDERHDRLIAAINQNDRYAAYGHASALNDTCKQSYYAVKDLDPPNGLTDKNEEAIENAMETCANAYFLKSQGYETMATVFDGDERPSAVTAAREASELAQMAVMKCAADYMVAAGEIGVPPTAFGAIKGAQQ